MTGTKTLVLAQASQARAKSVGTVALTLQNIREL